jgi:hypothetical protein
LNEGFTESYFKLHQEDVELFAQNRSKASLIKRLMGLDWVLNNLNVTKQIRKLVKSQLNLLIRFVFMVCKFRD